VTVVAAVIERDGCFLLTRRQRGVHLEGLWEFPGGKVDPGESHEAALKRELREELDADVEPRELVLATTHRYTDRTIALFFYRCVLMAEPRPLLGQDMRWVARTQLPSLDVPPADVELIRRLTASAVR
jgi:mutator protein MutT